MKQPPTIIIQIVHIEGPLKGEIGEYPESEVTVGRNPTCNVRFPKDLGIVSRQHARIVREGNRFKITDQSSNGTYLNGNAISEAYLKDGDVLMFAEGGPKVSFLTQTVTKGQNTPMMGVEAPSEISPAPVPPPEPPPASPSWTPRVDGTPPQQAPENINQPPAASAAPAQPPALNADMPQEVSVHRVKQPLYIQYGPTLQSYNELPVTIGQSPQCDFVINHPAVFERHAQILFFQEQYWVKDLSGKNPILINGMPIDREGILEPDCRLSLSTQGPEFRFLGGGRLAEIEGTEEETSGSIDEGDALPGKKQSEEGTAFKDLGGMVKKLLKR